MSHPPWFPFFVDDWLGSPSLAEMSMEEKGFYIEMMALSWKQIPRGSLPTSERSLGRLLGVDPRRVRRVLAGPIGLVWPDIDGRLVNKRMTQEAKKQAIRSEKARASVMTRYPTNVELSKHERATSIQLERDIDKKKKKILKEKAGKYSLEFDVFWMAYPKGRRVGKPYAWKSWKKIFSTSRQGTGIQPEEIINAVNAQIKSGMLNGGKFTPHPSSWLNGERWNDPIKQSDPNVSPTTLNILESHREEHDPSGGRLSKD